MWFKFLSFSILSLGLALGSASAQSIDVRNTGLEHKLGISTDNGDYFSINQLIRSFAPVGSMIEKMGQNDQILVRKSIDVAVETREGRVLNAQLQDVADYYVESEIVEDDPQSPQFGQTLGVINAITDGVAMASVCRCTSANGVQQPGTCSNRDCDDLNSCTGNTSRHCNWRASMVRIPR